MSFVVFSCARLFSHLFVFFCFYFRHNIATMGSVLVIVVAFINFFNHWTRQQQPHMYTHYVHSIIVYVSRMVFCLFEWFQERENQFETVANELNILKIYLRLSTFLSAQWIFKQKPALNDSTFSVYWYFQLCFSPSTLITLIGGPPRITFRASYKPMKISCFVSVFSLSPSCQCICDWMNWAENALKR